MPPARSAAARLTSARSAAPRPRTSPAPRPSRPRPRPRRVQAHGPRLRVRWERVGRYGLLVVLTIVVGLYVEHALAYVSTRGQADQQQAVVRSLQRQNAQLARAARSLSDPATIVHDARALGMVRPGERPYVISGLPRH